MEWMEVGRKVSNMVGLGFWPHQCRVTIHCEVLVFVDDERALGGLRGSSASRNRLEAGAWGFCVWLGCQPAKRGWRVVGVSSFVFGHFRGSVWFRLHGLQDTVGFRLHGVR